MQSQSSEALESGGHFAGPCAADSADVSPYAVLTVAIGGYAAPQIRTFTEVEFKEVKDNGKAIAPFNFTGMPIGATVAVGIALDLYNGAQYAGAPC